MFPYKSIQSPRKGARFASDCIEITKQTNKQKIMFQQYNCTVLKCCQSHLNSSEKEGQTERKKWRQTRPRYAPIGTVKMSKLKESYDPTQTNQRAQQHCNIFDTKNDLYIKKGYFY